MTNILKDVANTINSNCDVESGVTLYLDLLPPICASFLSEPLSLSLPSITITPPIPDIFGRTRMRGKKTRVACNGDIADY